MDFKTLLDMLRNPPEDGLPDTIYDDLGASFDNAESEWGSLSLDADNTIAALTAENEALKAKNTELMAHNYELLMNSGASPDESDDLDESDEDDFGDDDEPVNPYASLFSEKEND